ncbi:BglG family transcription antiterminator [Virgibacillus oceani]|nr:BglG family transcription antiterminator [Virgibacillus oceani]
MAGRVRKIIELLLQSQEDVTVKEIADALYVSERTVHRDLKDIEQIMHSYNLELMKKSGVGIRITGGMHDQKRLEMALSTSEASDYTPEERQTIILSTLLERNEPIKLFTLANELKVTAATISNDLDQLEIEIKDYHLQIIRKRGYGMKLEGEEGDKRAAISNLITKYINPFDYVSLLKENNKKNSQMQLNTISNRLLGFVNPEKLITIEKSVERAIAELPHELADSAYVGLIVHLALAIERLQKGDNITFDHVYKKQLEGTIEYEIAKNMIQELRSSLSMDIPEDEIGYITMHLLGAKLRIDNNYLIEDTSVDIANNAKDLIQYVSMHLDLDLTENKPLLHDLVAHLKPTIYRLKQGMNIKNPLLEDILRDYDKLFYIIREGVQDIFPEMDFPDDEIGYLVLHFAAILLYGEIDVDLKALVICSSGIGTSKMLATKLMQRIPEIKRVENKSMFELENSNLYDYDIIVSTIPLNGFEGKYIQASPMLTASEAHRIKKAIRQRKLTYTSNKKPCLKPVKGKRTEFILQLEAIQNYSKAILDILNSFRLIKIKENRSLEFILHSACNDLVNGQLVTNSNSVFEKLLKREQINGLGIPDTSLALFHARSKDVIKPCFLIYSLSNSLSVKGMDGKDMEMDTLLLMLAPELTHQEVLEIVSFISGLIIQDQESIQLFQSENEKQIKHFLSEQFHKYLQEKNIL